VGLDTQAASLAALAPFGTLVFFGEASGAPAPVVIDSLYAGSQRVGAFGLDLGAAPARYAQARTQLAAALCDASLSLLVGKVSALEQAAEAHAALEGRGTIGKLLLSPGEVPAQTAAPTDISPQ
jgi:NADPH2:quinone reductase